MVLGRGGIDDRGITSHHPAGSGGAGGTSIACFRRCGEVEFIMSTIWAAQSEAIELQDVLEVCEQHLGLFEVSGIAPSGEPAEGAVKEMRADPGVCAQQRWGSITRIPW